jgi:flavin reductase (DIM6/NTAB) family NADH-FMN oxidoreductase RutF
MPVPAVFIEPDSSAMRRTMGRFLTGVAVVTADQGDEHVGMTISSLTSISLDPPILMISLNLDTRTGNAVIAAEKFAISILGVKQEGAARQFAVRGGARFEAGDFEETDGGLPVISGALAQAECKLVNQYTIGDHQVFFGQVVSSRYRDGDALAFYSGKFGSFHDFHHEAVPWMF